MLPSKVEIIPWLEVLTEQDPVYTHWIVSKDGVGKTTVLARFFHQYHNRLMPAGA